ncbi:hypothetical protein L1049_004515 [Liquidambar formosana]|uniref:DELLA protein RGL1-like n=1 Tax=Liquidambar formosana TaxID=63359 RepID=A0AAP0RSP3_LIQFO
MFGIEDWGEIDSLLAAYGFYQENMAENGAHLPQHDQQQPPLQQQHQEPVSDYCVYDNFNFSAVSPPIPPVQEDGGLENIQTGFSNSDEPVKEKPNQFSLASLGLLSNYGSGLKKLKEGNLTNLSMEKKAEKGNLSNLNEETNMAVRKLSTEEVMRVAGARFVEFSTQKDADFSMLMHPFGHALSGLSEEEIDDIELAHHLLAAAEKVGCQQFDRASRLLSRCEWIASNTGNPVQRIVFYFAKALWERIDRETGRFNSKGLEEKGRNVDEGFMPTSSVPSLACYQELPFTQVAQFTGMQAIIENVASAKKVHLIDLRIRDGVHWTVLMQALVDRDEGPIELLKITAVGITGNQKLVDTGKRLESFAKSMNLNFSFKVVFVSNMKDVKEELFEIETDEAVAVFSPLILRTMISRPNCLETLMSVLKNLNPVIMVVTEVEANHNSPSFVNRFIEALFFCSAFFDCLEACMGRNDQTRMITEALLGEGIRNITSAEGEGRDTRTVKLDVWRAFFTKFGMVETQLSYSSLYQASLVAKQFACGKSCTLDYSGKCLIVGWKGTPIQSVSAWKFCCEEQGQGEGEGERES